jgi:hypothetical protein
MLKTTILGASLVLSVVVGAAAAEPAVTGLRCEYRADPLGIDVTQPRLSWTIRSATRGEKQTAYELLVASSAEMLAKDQGDLWQTGKVASDQSIHVVYTGKPLESRAACHWKVRIWGKDGKPSQWSKPAFWSMGLLKPEDWKAKWIGLEADIPTLEGPVPATQVLDARYLRRAFKVEKKVQRATAYISGLGLSEIYLNGRKVGDHVLSPGLTDYMKRVFYVTHDVTGYLKKGDNAVGAILGNGRFFAPRKSAGFFFVREFGFPKLLLQIEIRFADGSSQTIVSDENWKATGNGPIRGNNEFDGEDYDALRDMPGWDQPGFKDSARGQANLPPAPGGLLCAQMIEPIRVTETIHPVAISSPKPDVYVLDMGQNMVGWCRLKVTGPKGSKVSLRHAETLNRDGTLYTVNLGGALATDTDTLKGEGVETYEPRFTYHGFRYVELTGFPGKPTLDAIAGCVVHDAVPKAGEFTCSNELINRIWKNIVWSVRGNYRSIPTDCPQRAERQGWLGDRSVESKGETYLFNVAPFYAKWITDIEDTQASSTFSVRDLRDPPSFAAKLKQPADAVSTYVRAKLSDATRQTLAEWPGSESVSERIQKALVRDLNAIIQGELIHDTARFAGITLRPETTQVLSQNPRGKELASLNRWLLEDAYPLELSRDHIRKPDGSISDIAPTYWKGYKRDVTWPSSFIIIPGALYEQYGDVRVLQEHYDGMKKWIEYMLSFEKDGLMPQDRWGDWCFPPEANKVGLPEDPRRQTAGTVLGTTYFYHDLRLMARFASILGKPDDARNFDEIAERMKSAFNKKYLNAAAGIYGNGSETSFVLPLAFGMVPPENRQAVFENLANKISVDDRGHLATGLAGGQWICRVLSDNGRPDITYTLASQTTYPSWGYMIGRGATTIWKNWWADMDNRDFDGSGNHVMLVGDLVIWLVEHLAGIGPDIERPGFKHMIVRPHPLGDLKCAKASHESMYGTIRSSWTREGGKFTLDLVIPPNTTATVYLPATSAAAVTEGGRPVGEAEGVKFVKMDKGTIICEVVSGTYRFASEIGP